MPAMNRPTASNEVPTGRRMKGAQMFMRREGRRTKAEGRKTAEFRRPKRPSRIDGVKFGHPGQSRRDCILQPRVARHELPWVQSSKAPSTLKGLRHRLDRSVLAATPWG